MSYDDHDFIDLDSPEGQERVRRLNRRIREAEALMRGDAAPAWDDAPRPRWSKPMTLKRLGELLGGIDRRTMRIRYEHALRKIGRQAYQIDVNAVEPPYDDGFPLA